MAECIEREAAVALIEERQKELCPVGRWSRHEVYGTDREKFDAWQEIIDTLNGIPTVDAVVVTRCKDCRYAGGKRETVAEKRYVAGILFCGNSDLCGDEPLAMWPNDFCSYGEPKEAENGDDHD